MKLQNYLYPMLSRVTLTPMSVFEHRDKVPITYHHKITYPDLKRRFIQQALQHRHLL